MENSWKNVGYLIGIIVVGYLLIKFIVPLLFASIGFVIKIVLWLGLALLVIVVIAHIFKMLKK